MSGEPGLGLCLCEAAALERPRARDPLSRNCRGAAACDRVRQDLLVGSFRFGAKRRQRRLSQALGLCGSQRAALMFGVEQAQHHLSLGVEVVDTSPNSGSNFYSAREVQDRVCFKSSVFHDRLACPPLRLQGGPEPCPFRVVAEQCLLAGLWFWNDFRTPSHPSLRRRRRRPPKVSRVLRSTRGRCRGARGRRRRCRETRGRVAVKCAAGADDFERPSPERRRSEALKRRTRRRRSFGSQSAPSPRLRSRRSPKVRRALRSIRRRCRGA
mmetsp:Transcript_134371/g.429118  ORF Transcript_134371/g.429118 Transcript_134371/m.429118 type:complete len:269 (+) Transcript_134371:1121-1927(+)